MKFFNLALVCLFFGGCTLGANKTDTKLDLPAESKSYQNLLNLEKLIVNSDLSLNLVFADSLYRNSIQFIKKYPNSLNKEEVLVLAAKCSDGLNYNQENLNLINQLLLSFPDSKNAPNYLYNKGKIYEEKLKNIEKAKESYHTLIDVYPNSKIAESLKSYLLFLEKTEEEQFNFLKN